MEGCLSIGFLGFGTLSLTALCGVYGGSEILELLRTVRQVLLTWRCSSFARYLSVYKPWTAFPFLLQDFLNTCNSWFFSPSSIRLVFWFGWFFNKIYYLSKTILGLFSINFITYKKKIVLLSIKKKQLEALCWKLCSFVGFEIYVLFVKNPNCSF